MSTDKLAWTDYLENHYFIFGQQGRVPYTTAMEFGSDGTVKNYPAFNESRWQLNDDELVLLDGNGGPTTTFPLPATPQAVDSQGLVGHYLKDDQVVHTLRARDGSGFAPELVDLIVHRVQDQVHHDVRTTAENAARMVPKHQRIRVAFLLQSTETLPALEPLITLVHGDDRFEMKLLVTNKMFDYVESQNTLPEVAAYFSQRGYAFIEVTGDGTEAVAGLHRWQADFIVRQSEWDADYLPALSAEHLDWSRLIHVPYTITESALNLPNSDHQSLLVNPYYEHVWRYFTPEPLSAEQLHAIGGSFVARDIFQYVGSMKAQVIRQARPQWPDDRAGKRVVWMAHHSIFDAWFNFGTFPRIYKQMLQWTRDHGDVNVVFNPHPLLRENLRNDQYPGLPMAAYEQFLRDFTALPNGNVVEHQSQYGFTAAADVILTDGISSLYEMQVQRKPIVALLHPDHAEFTQVGQRLMRGVHATSDVVAAQQMVLRLLNHPDELRPQQKANTKQWLQNEHPERAIVQAMIDEMSS